MKFDINLVGKIGSMALINDPANDLNYNVISQISRELQPGYVWITSGATEIGRLDYVKRNGFELEGLDEDIKTDYSAQGQVILMQLYRQFLNSKYSLRQFLVEHQHFNDEAKKEHLKNALIRSVQQQAIPIINYNDPVSYEENRKLEIQSLKNKGKKAVECIDNDETASQVAVLLKPEILLILTSVDGIYEDITKNDALVKEISGKNASEVIENIEHFQTFCIGSSRPGANGARAKLEFVKEPVKQGTKVIIANSKYKISDILANKVPSTSIYSR